MEYRCKISLIGSENVGKTSLINRYVNHTFVSEYKATLGADFIDKEFSQAQIPLLKKNDRLIMTIWDQAGQKTFESIASIYLEGSAGIIMVFDVNNIESFQSLSENWYRIRQKICPDSELIVVGNKRDLDSEVSPEKIREIEDKWNLKVEFCSAKENSNVSDVFEKMATKIFESRLV